MTDIRTNFGSVDGTAASRGASGSSAAAGDFRGAPVRVVDQNSLLADAAEELTSLRSEHEEKDIAKRDVEDGRRADSLERILRLKNIDELLRTLGDLDKRDLFRGLKALLKRQGGRQGYREQARQDFKEPSHQFAALSALVEALKARGAPQSQIDEAEAARDSLMEERGAEIRAALNIGDAANEASAAGLGTLSELREAYRENSEDFQDMGSVLDKLTSKFGPDRLRDAIAFMTKALASDMAAGGSSINKSKLATIIADLKKIEILTTILGNAEVVAARARRRGGARTLTGAAILAKFTPFLDANSIRPSSVKALVQFAQFGGVEGRINFLTDIKSLADAVPVRAFASPEARFKVLGSIQNVLDEEIEEEERAFDDDEEESS